MPDKPVPLSSIQILSEIEGGRFVDDLVLALKEMANETVGRQKGTKSSVALTVKMEKVTADSPAIAFAFDIKKNPPKRLPRNAEFYAMDGELYRRDPRDDVLPTMREVIRGTGEIIETPQAAAPAREATQQ